MKAFITGVTGQDGYYLSRLLIRKGYEVYGLVRRTSQQRPIPEGVISVPGDVTDPSVTNLIEEIKPDEIYNLAAMSYVWESFKIPRSTFDINATGALNVLEAAKKTGCKVYQASTSELYGSSPPPQNELTPFYPRSPYGVAKLAAYWATVNYREAYGLFACIGQLFNHESPIRSIEFVTRKTAVAVARIKHGLQKELRLGNLEAKRDWGFAGDYVNAMWLMMQQEESDTYVIATGESHSVKEMVEIAFDYVGLDWEKFVVLDKEFYRPADVDYLLGDPAKAKLKLGWNKTVSFKQLIEGMVCAELKLISGQKLTDEDLMLVGSGDMQKQKAVMEK